MEIRVARSAIETIRRAAASEPAGIDIHDQATGGILIGKYLAGDQIEIVAATEPGPAPDNRQLGFALDLAHANTILESWFDRDPDVDVVGSWHTHPSVIERPTIGDREAAYTLFAGDYAGAAYVSLIALSGRGIPAIRGFYLSAADAAERADFTAIPYTEFDDGHAPETTARQYPLPATPPRQPAPPEPVRLAPAGAIEPERPWRAILLTALVVIVLVAAAYFLLSRRNRTGQTPPGATLGQTATAGLVATFAPESTVAATIPAITTEPPASTALPVVTESAATETVPVAVPATESAAPATTVAATASATVAASQTAEAAQPTPIVDPSLPYTLRISTMDSAATTAFLARARKLNCEVCYNVDITGPVPYQELRIRLVGTNRPALRNYEVPSLALLPPRDTPYTLQVFDLKGKAASPLIPVSVAEGKYYVLAIEATRP